ncbi:CLUMA_CG004089, isoform A [Clunio marinus]|uniref:CLUMA_CG004089, isoform A n=1 Tax=Clunio marinus TaxID=568069 RepID=A0A1J1HQI8_9DIPT|nr:CLUMA_CG004089, isoform A [Clunio marinus]
MKEINEASSEEINRELITYIQRKFYFDRVQRYLTQQINKLKATLTKRCKHLAALIGKIASMTSRIFTKLFVIISSSFELKTTSEFEIADDKE